MKLLEIFQAPQAKRDALENERSKIAWTDPETQTAILSLLASKLNHRELQLALIKLKKGDFDTDTKDILKNALNRKATIVCSDYGLTKLDVFDGLESSIRLESFDVTGCKVKSWDPIKHIRYKTIVMDSSQPYLKFMMEHTVPNINIVVSKADGSKYKSVKSGSDMWALAHNTVSALTSSLTVIRSNIIANKPITKAEALKIQQDLIDDGFEGGTGF